MKHPDPIYARFLEDQHPAAMALAAASDRLVLTPFGPESPVTTYFAHFRCKGLVRRAGQVIEHNDHLVGIRFPKTYLKEFDTARVLTWCQPVDPWHPNIQPPFICAGRMQPGTPLVDLIYQIYEIITWQNVETREFNALNHDACVWARHNLHRLPVDRRPLRRRVRTAGDEHQHPVPAIRTPVD